LQLESFGPQQKHMASKVIHENSSVFREPAKP
jgi:hypothetical protein